MDICRFLNFYEQYYSWSNSSRSVQSRIDLWLVSPDCVQCVTEVAYSYAPLSDHRMVVLVLSGCKMKNNSLRGYWKLNNNLLSNESFGNHVREIAQQIFSNKQITYIKKLFKFKVRQSAIHFSKQAKYNSLNKEHALMTELDIYLKKVDLTEDEIEQIYIDTAKGAFICSRARVRKRRKKYKQFFPARKTKL